MYLNRNSCWGILGIEKTQDKKIIKKAYHKLLRTNKPDENPEGFKIIHQAYLNALSQNDWITFDEDMSNELASKSLHDDETSKQEVQEPTSYEKPEEKDPLDKLYKSIDALTYLNEDVEIFNDINNWIFIDVVNFNFDFHRRELLSHYLFDAVNFADKKFNSALLSAEVIGYLDSIFMWSKYWNNYDIHAKIFEYLNIKDVGKLTTYSIVSRKKRIKAILIDSLIVIGIYLAFVMLVHENEIKDFVYELNVYHKFNTELFAFSLKELTVIYVFSCFPMFLTNFKRTFGQSVIGIVTVEELDSFYGEVSHVGMAIRQIITYLSVISLVLFLTSSSPTEVGFGFVVCVANVILFASKGIFVQDLWATKLSNQK